jgi:sugar phosphate isomerase/epimerase
MSFGVSTSCLYPQNTEEALIELGKLGVKTCEVFLNSPCEITRDFAKTLNRIKDEYGMEIVSVHPFSSFAETYMLFSEYSRRFDDTLDIYKRTFEFAAEVGAKFSAIHGSLLPGKISNNEYFERFCRLHEKGREAGMFVCQENVNRHFSQNPDFLKDMRNFMGSDFKMIFDVKQAVRSGYDAIEFAKEFKSSIVHVHLSDNKEGFDCLPPGCGSFDFKKLFAVMDSVNYGGSYIIELYRSNFEKSADLRKALDYVEEL